MIMYLLSGLGCFYAAFRCRKDKIDFLVLLVFAILFIATEIKEILAAY
ncbi:hypothetical protein AVCANL277_06710 [Campylobacter canadensis]|nr:hypothetical protein [Campylobacter canadensis]MBZ8000552.1 hypothetical protein [Campylobacter canadensis]